MTTWPSIPGPWDRPATDNVIGTLGPDDFARPGDEVKFGAQPPLLDLRGRTVQPRRTVVDNRSNPGLEVRNVSWPGGWLNWSTWREVVAPELPLVDPTGDGRGWILTDTGAYEYQGRALNGLPQLWNPAIATYRRTNVGYYPWGQEWSPLPAGTVGTTTGGLPDIALFRMTRGEPIDHALHVGLPADLLRLPQYDTVTKRLDPGYVWPASHTDIHPPGHPLYAADRGRQDGTPGVPMGARIRLPHDQRAVIAGKVDTGGLLSMSTLYVLAALHAFGGYVTTTAMPTTHPAGRMTFGLTDDYLTADERRALTAALQGATWEVIVDG